MGVDSLKSYIIVHGMYVAARSRNEYASSAILSLCKYRLTHGYGEYTRGGYTYVLQEGAAQGRYV